MAEESQLEKLVKRAKQITTEEGILDFCKTVDNDKFFNNKWDSFESASAFLLKEAGYKTPHDDDYDVMLLQFGFGGKAKELAYVQSEFAKPADKRNRLKIAAVMVDALQSFQLNYADAGLFNKLHALYSFNKEQGTEAYTRIGKACGLKDPDVELLLSEGPKAIRILRERNLGGKPGDQYDRAITQKTD